VISKMEAEMAGKILKVILVIFLSSILILYISACQKQNSQNNNNTDYKISDSEEPEKNKGKFPEKSIQIVVPFFPGGGTDHVARALAEVAKDYFGQPIVVVNKVGGSGSLGLTEGAMAKPDGYTVTLTLVELTILPHQGMANVTYKDFKPILQLNEDPAALTVRADAPWNTVEEFLAYAKKNPGKIRVGNSGEGSVWHLAAKTIERETGVKLTHTQFDGAAPAGVALLGGEVDAVAISPAEVMTHVKNGELKILGVMAENRMESLPDVPTFKELGIDIEMVTWRGISVPKDTPEEVVEILRKGFMDAANDKHFKEIMVRLGLGYNIADAEEFQNVIKESDEFYKGLIEEFKNKD